MTARACGVAVAVAVAWFHTAPSFAAEGGTSCPLSIGEQVESVKKFAPIAKFLTHEPRCFNCHGGVNPHIDGVGPDPEDKNAPESTVKHGGGAQDRGVGGFMAEGCENCHDNMAPRRNGSKSKWFTAPPPSTFVGKDAPKLCRQIKRINGTAEGFLGHLEDDNGGNSFVRTAFVGNRGLNPEWYKEFPPQRPSLDHDALMRLGEDWVEAMGGTFKGDESCGCEVRLRLNIEHHIASRRDYPRVVVGGPIYDGTVRFELKLAPFPTMPGQQRNESEVPLEFTGETTVVREFSVGHITSKAAGQGTQTETWRVYATVDPESETLKLRVAMFSDAMDAWWDGAGGRSEVTVPLDSEIGQTMDRSNAPLSMPFRSGSRQTFAPSGPEYQETLTVSVPE
jgi:hypothetical protein